MSWYFSVALPADPAPCHGAAATLRAVARAAEEAADFLGGQSVLPREDFSGAAAQSYRAASTALNADSEGVAGDTRALAEALDDYADRIAAVRRALTRVRDDATLQGLDVTADDRVEWIPVPGTAIDAAYQRLEARAVRAHTEAEAAYADWWRAVQEHTTGPLAPTDPPAAHPPLDPAPAPIPPAPDPPEPDPPEPDPPEPDQPVRADERRDAAVPTAPDVPPRPAPDRHHERRAPADRDVDLEFAPLPLRWQPFADPPAPYDCPTDTEGAQR